MTANNPFLPTRFEFETNPLIWKSQEAKELEKRQSYFLRGTRGSGKTSILKAINWHERINNVTLINQLETGKWDCLAVYFRLPDHMSQSINRINWEKITPDAPQVELVSFSYFSLFIESIILESLFAAIIDLRMRGVFDYDISKETEIVAEILGKFPELSKFDNSYNASGFLSLKQLFDKLHHKLNAAATRGRVGAIFEDLPHAEPGEIMNFVADIVFKLISENMQNPNFHFKICVDDCETLHENQQIFLNTLLRKSKAPVFWVISFVSSDYETSNTMIHNQVLSDADRKVLDLDIITPASFKQLCTAVTSLRTFFSLPEQLRDEYSEGSPAELVSLDQVLGRYSLNELFAYATRRNLLKTLPDLIKRAEYFSSDKVLRGNTKSRSLPFYETYIVDRIFSGLSLPADAPTDERTKFRAVLRRKQVGAFLSMCSEYGVKRVPFAGSGIVLSLSDSCIRDFLEIMGSIYDYFKPTGDDKVHRFVFRRGPIDINTQTKGIVTSSQQKFMGIKKGKETSEVLTNEVSKLVEGLGVLTAMLQSSSENLQALRTAERGVFVFDFANTPAANDMDEIETSVHLALVVKRAMLDGLLRPKHFTYKTTDSVTRKQFVGYRLHKRYAPKFGFSYRGAYEPISIDMSDMVDLCLNRDDVNVMEWAKRAYKKISSHSYDQGEFDFGGED